MEKKQHVIEVNADKCVRCGRCTRICPAGIFTLAEAGIAVEHPENCIECGHCVDVCPPTAIWHSFFPPSSLHTYSLQDLPDPDSLMTLMKARRSNRAFSEKEVPSESLRKIMEAALLAPTAQNTRNVRVISITDMEKIHAVSAFTVDGFYKALRLLENGIVKCFLYRKMRTVYAMLPKFKKMHEAFYKEGKDAVLRNAKAVLFFYAPSDSRFGSADCNLAYQNASLMAESLGIAQFYTGFVLSALQRDKKQTLNKKLGIPEDMRIYAGMALGMPSFRFERYSDRMPEMR